MSSYRLEFPVRMLIDARYSGRGELLSPLPVRCWGASLRCILWATVWHSNPEPPFIGVAWMIAYSLNFLQPLVGDEKGDKPCEWRLANLDPQVVLGSKLKGSMFNKNLCVSRLEPKGISSFFILEVAPSMSVAWLLKRDVRSEVHCWWRPFGRLVLLLYFVHFGFSLSGK